MSNHLDEPDETRVRACLAMYGADLERIESVAADRLLDSIRAHGETALVDSMADLFDAERHDTANEL